MTLAMCGRLERGKSRSRLNKEEAIVVIHIQDNRVLKKGSSSENGEKRTKSRYV